MMVLNQIEAKKAQNNRNFNLEEEVTDDKNKLNIVEQRYKYNNDGTLRNGYFNNMEYQYKYNLEGMLESKSASGKTLLRYTYDKNNNIKTIKDISGRSSVYYYDENNRLKSITDDKEAILAEYHYYNNDAIKSVKLGNGVKSDYTYDGDGNVKSLVTIGANGQLLLDYKYAYDLNGNRIEKIGSKHKNYYSYDSMNRLKETTYDNRSENFTYDKAGNRLTKTTEGIVEKYRYNAKNQLKEISNNNEKTLFTYDLQGNTIKEETNRGNNIFEYNTLNQQIKAVTKEGNTLVNRYDNEGLRYEIEENEKLARFIFNKNGDILTETDSNDNIVSRFTRGYEIVSADIKSNSPTNCNLKCTRENDDLERYFYTTDEQGSTALITSNAANICNEYYYDAFGNVLESKEDVHNRITYTGQQFDSVTSQYYLRARFYNPKVGRFTQEDIYRGDGLNLCDYCRSNPVRYYDPSGYTKCPASKEIQLNTKGVTQAEGKIKVPTVKSGEFNDWFNSLSVDELDSMWQNKSTRRAIERQLRAPGGMHEWHLVSRAPQFKNWGVNVEQIRDLRTAISDVEFINPVGKHGQLGSTTAHNELLDIIDSSTDYDMFTRRLNNWANYRLKGGVDALPEGLRLK